MEWQVLDISQEALMMMEMLRILSKLNRFLSIVTIYIPSYKYVVVSLFSGSKKEFKLEPP